MRTLDLFIDGKHITNEEELHKFLIEKFKNEGENYIKGYDIEDSYRGKKKKKQECKPSGPKQVCLKFMYPYKIELQSGCKQMIFGILVDPHGHPIHHPIIELELSDYNLGNVTFSPAISFHDGYFFTTFIGENPGCGELKLCCKGTDLDKVIPIRVESIGCC